MFFSMANERARLNDPIKQAVFAGPMWIGGSVGSGEGMEGPAF